MEVVELPGSPALAPLFAKAALTGPTRKGGELPERAYRLSGVRVDPAHLAEYDRVCGFRLADALPPTYPHVLAFPAQVRLMTDRDFPFPLIGSVHVANRVEQRRPLRVDEPFDLRVHVENAREHPKGRQYDVVSAASVDGETAWREVSTYLRREGGSTGSARPDSDASGPPAPTAVWDAPADTGRRYAAVSGDRNPIHLHPLTARPFGFRRAVAHGMWSKARCLAALGGGLPEACVVDVRFKLPVLLPARLALTATGTGFLLADARSGRPHLEGAVDPSG